ncbi:hypothetical protein SEEH3343_20945, partial [Salmonella enterica subsp. enterica serovar Heidelberg str. RI-11-013343]
MQQMNKHVTVYPRWRGEHSLSSMRNFPRRGLSPLARGTLPFTNNNIALQRFYPRWRGEHRCVRLIQCVSGGLLPAGAGNTDEIVNKIIGAPVYPRWRG